MQRSTAAKGAAAAAVAVTGGLVLASGPARADSGFSVIGVPYASPRAGVQGNVLTPSARQTAVAWGNLPSANPGAANGVTHYGYDTTLGGPLTRAANEDNETEPDKNVYLVSRSCAATGPR